jgi:hypothetical protein
MITGNVIHKHVSYNITAIQKQPTGSLIKEILGKRISVIDSMHSINKAIVCSGGNDVNHNSDEVLNSPDGQNKIRENVILYTPSVKRHFPEEFQGISNIFLCIP